MAGAYDRLHIDLDDSALHQRIKIAAARHGTSVSAYCAAAIRRRSAVDELVSDSEDPREAAAQALDRLRRQIGRIGEPVAVLVAEGRR